MPPAHNSAALAATSDNNLEDHTRFPQELSPSADDVFTHRSTEKPEGHDLYWALGPHEISAATIVLVTFLLVGTIALLYLIYKRCRCCSVCREEATEEADIDAKISDVNIQSILKSRKDWDQRAAESEVKLPGTSGSIASFLDGNI